ncbi:hypothetical protein CEXT_166121 [Caerostris extrusa]|uniref:Uncharacterized protein n=1 Tax=Caerostris extrusa TaxID=172846 RepID=A0AAV4QJM3_CAEEX|nr:hypothetical protein CEXT_166121 [Caerostris extrusa]
MKHAASKTTAIVPITTPEATITDAGTPLAMSTATTDSLSAKPTGHTLVESYFNLQCKIKVNKYEEEHFSTPLADDLWARGMEKEVRVLKPHDE